MTRKEIIERMLKMAENISMDSLTLYVMTNRDLEVVAAAAALLKEQEPRVMTLEEIHGRMHVWLEYIEKNEVVLAIGGDSCGGAKCFITEYDENVALKDRQYNMRWRAWTQRPTRAQMEAIPWHSEEKAGE